MSDETPATPVVATRPTRTRRDRRRVVLELAIVTTGVLIALLLDGLVEWNRYRVLVNEARATIARELDANGREVETVLATMEVRRKRLSEAQRFAEELLAERKPDINELKIHSEFADLTAAAWHGAQQTGALAHMPFEEVQRYSRLYDLQELYAAQQRRALDTLAAATGVLSADTDPYSAAPDDLRAFRQHVVTLKAQMLIEEQLGKRLLEGYKRILTR